MGRKDVDRVIGDKLIFRWEWKDENLKGIGLWEIYEGKMYRGWLYANEVPSFIELVNDPSQLYELRIKDKHPWILSRKSADKDDQA